MVGIPNVNVTPLQQNALQEEHQQRIAGFLAAGLCYEVLGQVTATTIKLLTSQLLQSTTLHAKGVAC